jgi:hypothetical protein
MSWAPWAAARQGSLAAQRGQCRACRHFQNGDAAYEALLPGMTSLSSAQGSVRSEDGLCARHERYAPAYATCGDFSGATLDD